MPAMDDKPRSVSLHLPEPTFSLLSDYKAQIFYDDAEEDLATVTKEVEIYSPFFEQVGVGITQAGTKVKFVKPYLSTVSCEETTGEWV